MQIVNIFLSIVCKPKRFLFCMFLFVVKWWEIPLEGSLVACKWRAIRWPLVQDLSWLFSVKFNICKVFLNRGYIPFDYHHEKWNRLSQLVPSTVGNTSIGFPAWRISFYHPQAGPPSDVLEDFSFAGKQTLQRLNANKPIAVNTCTWYIRSARDGFQNNN